MSGSPIDGLPWWAKAMYHMLLAPVYVVEVVVNTGSSVVNGVKRVVSKDKTKT